MQISANRDKAAIFRTLKKYWGYTEFRPYQEETILSILEGADTLTILPTGGGKSLCFQLPALLSDGLAIVISPLISLMKDQVDDLKDLGVAAECLNSSLSPWEQRSIMERVAAGALKLLYLSPERLLMEHMLSVLKSVRIAYFVVDEAHCISHWGHDFRQEYRQLGLLKREFENIPIHAFTATATETVRDDIARELCLHAPRIVVGDIDRPNLTYRVIQRQSGLVKQIGEVIEKHRGQPGIIYCLKRKDVDEISKSLNALGYKNLPYHAGLDDATRKKNQEEFLREEVDIIVATIAFGMGVDRSNIRYVIHCAMPKSIEHFQQETGRAGRDGLPSDCYFFYSGADYGIWKSLLADSSESEVMLRKLGELYDFCTRPQCRHRSLAHYFGQTYAPENCGACDFCLGEVDMAEEPLLIGQKVLSCVARVRQSFEADHVADILKGNATEAVLKWRHEKLSTFGLMEAETKVFIRFMIEQLVGQGFLRREGDYGTLAITGEGMSLLKGLITPKLAKPATREKKKEIEKKRRSRRAEDWENVDEGLFEALRLLRAKIARDKSVPAYLVFSDKALKDMASKKPRDKEAFAGIYGVGEAKLKEYADAFIEAIGDYRTSPPESN
ncbi:MAG: DNA helicase RecQ [Rectinemataceae bacterium]